MAEFKQVAQIMSLQFSGQQWALKLITLVVTQNLCVSEPVTQAVNVNQTPVVDFTSGITSGCVPLTVDFENTSTNTATGVNYLWDFGAAGTSTTRSVSHEFTQPGTYDVTLRVTNPGNCVTTKNVPVMVEVWPRPVAAFTANPMKVSLKNPIINFTSTSTGTDLSYVWNTGDGNTYTLPSFTHTYVDSGLFTVEMTVLNGLGCDNLYSEIIHITPRYMLKVPTAFSPNGDGMNDQFRIIGNGVKKFRISIYNRWGTLVFTTEDINNSWDGLINGQPAQPGPYVYHTYFMDDNDEVSEQSGSFVFMK
jgi:gliding motility-associated-like protein